MSRPLPRQLERSGVRGRRQQAAANRTQSEWVHIKWLPARGAMELSLILAWVISYDPLSKVSNSIKKSFMFYFVITLVVVIVVLHFLALLIVKLVDCFEPLHCPICKLPSLAPPDVHRLRANYHHYKLDSFVANTGCEAWPSWWGNSSFYSVDSSLSQHQVRVVPLVCLSISIRVLLHDHWFRAHYFLEKRQFHCVSAQLSNIKCSWLVVWISQSVRWIVGRSFQIELLSSFIHLL